MSSSGSWSAPERTVGSSAWGTSRGSSEGRALEVRGQVYRLVEVELVCMGPDEEQDDKA